MTAKEILERSSFLPDIEWEKEVVTVERAEDLMIEFAKQHVELALQSANRQSRIIADPNSYTGNTGSEYPADDIVDSESILNAYPLENIK